MRTKSTNFLIVTVICIIASLAMAGSALADSGSGDTSAAGATETKTPVDTKAPVDTKTPVDTSTKPPVETTAPKTEVPKTPVTVTTPTTTSTTPPSTCSNTSACETPGEPELPEEPECSDRPDAADCVPDAPVRDVVPEAPGGGDLPFTGPGDVVLALVIALLAGTGGILFLLGASGREQLDGLSPRGMDSPSGFHIAYRELRKQQLGADD